jgi:hypothetical protein
MPLRKRVGYDDSVPAEADWLDLERIATVEVSSEDPDHPIENALLPTSASPWRAASPGSQTIRILFDQPQHLRRIRLRFVEPAATRTQELVLSWAGDRAEPFREILRQQWNFSPSGATEELEDRNVDLADVSALELRIKPDISGGDAVASLMRLQLA